jgi:hypothetical protein
MTGCNKILVATHPPSNDPGFVTEDCAPFLSDAVTDPLQVFLHRHSTSCSIESRKNKREKLQNSGQISSVGTNCGVQHKL